MGKSLSRRHQREEDTVWVPLDEVFMSESTWEKLVRRDFAQIEELRAGYDDGLAMIRVVLKDRFGGGYNIEDGRHRVVAAKLAGESHIEALIVTR